MATGEYRLVVLGARGVGKSALTVRLVTDNFLDEYDPTTQDSYIKHVMVDDEAAPLEIVDTAGQEQFVYFEDLHMRWGTCFLLVYNIVSRPTLNRVCALHDKILRIKDTDKVPIVLVGNKCDLKDQRQVSYNDGAELAKQWGCQFFETSAKMKLNNEACFFELVREIRKQAKPTGKLRGKCNSDKQRRGLHASSSLPLSDDTSSADSDSDHKNNKKILRGSSKVTPAPVSATTTTVLPSVQDNNDQLDELESAARLTTAPESHATSNLLIETSSGEKFGNRRTIVRDCMEIITKPDDESGEIKPELISRVDSILNDCIPRPYEPVQDYYESLLLVHGKVESLAQDAIMNIMLVLTVFGLIGYMLIEEYIDLDVLGANSLALGLLFFVSQVKNVTILVPLTSYLAETNTFVTKWRCFSRVFDYHEELVLQEHVKTWQVDEFYDRSRFIRTEISKLSNYLFDLEALNKFVERMTDSVITSDFQRIAKVVNERAVVQLHPNENGQLSKQGKPVRFEDDVKMQKKRDAASIDQLENVAGYTVGTTTMSEIEEKKMWQDLMKRRGRGET